MKSRAILISLCATAMTAGGLVLGATPAFASITNSSGYVHIQNMGSGKCIDVGPPVEQWRCLNTFNEEWGFVAVGRNSYEIFSHTNGQCLTQADSRANGTPVVYEPCTGGQSQTWDVIYSAPNSGRNFMLLNLSHGQCLDLENGDTSDGVPMQVWDCNTSTNNQRWGQL